MDRNAPEPLSRSNRAPNVEFRQPSERLQRTAYNPSRVFTCGNALDLRPNPLRLDLSKKVKVLNNLKANLADGVAGQSANCIRYVKLYSAVEPNERNQPKRGGGPRAEGPPQYTCS